MIFCVCIPKRVEGLVVPRTEKHERLFEVRTCTYIPEAIICFITRENASFASLARLIT